MVRAITTAAALGFLAAIAHADLDFTPFDSFYEIEGIRVPNLNFHNSGKVISYTPPPDWKTSGRGKKLTLLPPQAVQAGATFEAVPAGPEPLAAEEANVTAFRKLAVEILPPEATNVEAAGAGVSALRLCGRPAVAVLLSYTFFGQQFRMSVLFIPHDEELLRVRFTAHAADFAPLEKIFRRSLYTLQGL
jgi:hypothetical protein